MLGVVIFLSLVAKGVGKGNGGGGGGGGGARGAEAPLPQILTHVTLLQKNLEKQERKKHLLGYKHATLRHFQPTCMV